MAIKFEIYRDKYASKNTFCVIKTIANLPRIKADEKVDSNLENVSIEDAIRATGLYNFSLDYSV